MVEQNIELKSPSRGYKGSTFDKTFEKIVYWKDQELAMENMHYKAFKREKGTPALGNKVS